MASEPLQIFPNDLIANRAIGVRLPLSQKGVFGSTFTTQDAIKYNLVNYLLTNPGELPGNPEFGAGLRNFVFEHIQDNDLDGLEDQIRDGIDENVEYVELNNITVSATPDRNQVSVQIDYSLPATDVIDSLTLAFN